MALQVFEVFRVQTYYKTLINHDAQTVDRKRCDSEMVQNEKYKPKL